MAWTSPTTINASEGMGSFLPYLSDVTHFWFGRMIMIAIWIIFLFGYLKAEDDFIGAIAVASYVTFVVGLIFWVMGIVSDLDFAIIIGVTVVSSVILFVNQKN